MRSDPEKRTSPRRRRFSIGNHFIAFASSYCGVGLERVA
jgi:hypothetical protein